MTSPVTATRSRPSLSSPGLYPAAILAAVAVFSAAFAFGVDMLGHAESAPAPGEPRFERTLAGRELTIPASVFRYAAQRVDGEAAQLDLRFSLHLQRDDATRLVDVTLVGSDGVRPSTRLLDEVYGPRFAAGEVTGPAGLTGREIAGTDGDTVWYEADANDAFVAKCDAPIARGVQPRCLRTVHVASGIAAIYAFDFEMLDRWREFDTAVEPWLSTIGVR